MRSVDWCDVAPAARVDIYDGEAELLADGETSECHAAVWFSWERGVVVRAVGSGPFSTNVKAALGPLGLRVPDIGTFDVTVCTSDTSWPPARWEVDGWAASSTVDDDFLVDHVTFQVANFITSRSSTTLTLDDGHYVMELEQHPEARSRTESLKLEGGGATTHVGTLRRRDGGQMAWGAADSALAAAQVLLAFAAGDRVPVLLPLGHTSDGDPTAFELRAPRRESYVGRLAWCNGLLVDQVPNLWGRLRQLWSTTEGEQFMRIAIELYVEAQHADLLETRLVHAMSLLQWLSWHHLVHRERKSAATVDRKTQNNASWPVRQMLRNLNVDPQVPDDFSYIRREYNGYDGPKVIAELRNSVVHPRGLDVLFDVPRGLKHDVLNLALWYADLALLSLLGHEGNYLRRAQPMPYFSGPGEPLPWAP